MEKWRLVPCGCTFVAVGKPLDYSTCAIHDERIYQCDYSHGSCGDPKCVHNCKCVNYRPARTKSGPIDWPVCVCHHSAQSHNKYFEYL